MARLTCGWINRIRGPGIDISARATLPVKSVFDGYVSTITFIAGYGTTVIIDHNNSYYTVFTHLENLLISENMNVKEGQNIGYVSNDNIIHFEIWGNNQKLNRHRQDKRLSRHVLHCDAAPAIFHI